MIKIFCFMLLRRHFASHLRRSRNPPQLYFHRPIRFIHSSSSILRPDKCPNCTATLPSLLPACTNCWHISPLPSNTRLHDIFGLPYHPNPFTVNVATLKQKFREAQAICHPDSWASKGSVSLYFHSLLIHFQLVSQEQARCCPSFVFPHQRSIPTSPHTSFSCGVFARVSSSSYLGG